MKISMSGFWRGVSRFKYLIVVVIGVAVVGFLDNNSIMRHLQYKLQISDLQDEIDRYNAQSDAAMKVLRGLKSNPKSIEKIAREHYFMKADNEDVYVLSTDEQTTDNQQ